MKKSFVMYSDMMHVVDIMSNEQAGQLLKTILHYVNGFDVEFKDTVVKIAFEPIRQQLKRDLAKYEKKVATAQTNGKKGGRPKKPTLVSNNQEKGVSVNGNGNGNDNGSVNENDIVLPWQTTAFADAWNLWKDYKKKQFRFQFKTSISETTALKKLYNLAEGNENTALLIMEQSVANGWKGFFKLPPEAKKVTASEDYLENLKNRLNGKA